MNTKLLLPALLLLFIARSATSADFIAPPSDSSPAVVVISGASGTFRYWWYAKDVAKLGYAVALVAGKEICPSSSSSCAKTDEESAANLRRTIAKLQSNKRVAPGKVAVVSFSLGACRTIGKKETFFAECSKFKHKFRV